MVARSSGRLSLPSTANSTSPLLLVKASTRGTLFLKVDFVLERLPSFFYCPQCVDDISIDLTSTLKNVKGHYVWHLSMVTVNHSFAITAPMHTYVDERMTLSHLFSHYDHRSLAYVEQCTLYAIARRSPSLAWYHTISSTFLLRKTDAMTPSLSTFHCGGMVPPVRSILWSDRERIRLRLGRVHVHLTIAAPSMPEAFV